MNIELNNEQMQAMLATEGPVLVTAGAGSGKTRLLTQRIAYLIEEKKVDGYNIIAITFTNKAAKEMKDRIDKIVGSNSFVWISTIHSMCVTILRRDIEKLNPNYNGNFTIYTPDDTNKVLKKAMVDVFGEEKAKDKDEKFLKNVQYHMDIIKNANYSYSTYLELNKIINDIEDYVKVIKRYQEILEDSNALDFDDLLTFTENLLKKNEEVRNYYSNRFRYILVDEFQDTNVVQYNIIKLLAKNHKNIFVVGDEDQCIYGWRGANIKNINNFIKDFENCKVFKLEQNYRSTQNILDIANKLISNNHERIEKSLKANQDSKGLIIYRSFDSDKREAEYVAQTIYSLHQKGVRYNEMAILMRLNALSRNFEEKLLAYNIPYVVFGGFKFFDRLEVKNAVAYLKFIANPNDYSSFARIINFPKRGIGEVTVDKIVLSARDYNLTLFEMCENIDMVSSITSTTRQKIKDFIESVNEIKQSIDENGISEGISFLIKRAGFKDLYREKSEENRNRLLNLDSLVESAQEFEDNTTNHTLTAYLENITLVSDADTETSDEQVTIASVHAVKGLEFKTVFIVGTEQKNFPIVRDDIVDEEERRLMYVAVTRAKEYLYLTNSTCRYMYGHYDYLKPSVFLKEMGFITENSYDSIENSPKTNTYGIKTSFYEDDYEDYRKEKPSFVKKGGNKTLQELNKSRFYIPDKKESKSGFDVGNRVNHSHYGQGTIIAVAGEGAGKIVTVQFDVVGKKELLLDFAPLTLID